VEEPSQGKLLGANSFLWVIFLHLLNFLVHQTLKKKLAQLEQQITHLEQQLIQPIQQTPSTATVRQRSNLSNKGPTCPVDLVGAIHNFERKSKEQQCPTCPIHPTGLYAQSPQEIGRKSQNMGR
jgi:hypothetical protein